MSHLTLMRLYLRMQSMPRLPLPCIGYAGILYSGAHTDRNRNSYMMETGSCTSSPEFAATRKLYGKKGIIGCYRSGRGYSTSISVEDVKKAEIERLTKKKVKPMTAETIKIMLVSETGSISTMTLLDAQSLAKKKRLELVHLDDREKPVGTHKEAYKLVSKLSSLDAEVGDGDDGESVKNIKEHKPKEKRDEKTMLLKSNTGENDVNSKINMMLKWLRKGHRIRVLIGQAGDKGNAESIFKKIESGMVEIEGQIQQKILKGKEIRFYVAPPKVMPPPKAKPAEHQNDEDGQGDDEYRDSDGESVKSCEKK